MVAMIFEEIMFHCSKNLFEKSHKVHEKYFYQKPSNLAIFISNIKLCYCQEQTTTGDRVNRNNWRENQEKTYISLIELFECRYSDYFSVGM